MSELQGCLVITPPLMKLGALLKVLKGEKKELKLVTKVSLFFAHAGDCGVW